MAVVLAGDGRMFVPCPGQRLHGQDHREFREADVIARGLTAMNPEIRWRAAQATARLTAPGLLGELRETAVVLPACSATSQIVGGLEAPRRWQPGQLFRLLRDRTVNVRKEAAYAIGVRLADAGLESELVTAAGIELRGCLLNEADPQVQGLLLEAIGVAHYGSDALRSDAEMFITQQSNGAPLKVLGAAKGLEALIRQNVRRRPDIATLSRLRQMVLSGNRASEPTFDDVDARIRRLALMSLEAVGDFDPQTIAGAMTDGDWQVRRILAGRLNPADENQASVVAQLENDSAFQVRYDLLGAQARLIPRTNLCQPIIARLKDPSPLVAMRAMELLAPTCTDLEQDAIPMLKDLADSLNRSDSHEQWHLPSRALTSLARLKPELAAAALDGAVAHPAWQVRAAAAATCVTLQAVGQARKLADDREPNVRTAALDALFRMKDGALVKKAIAAIKSTDDHQLLRMAAQVMKGQVGDEDREDANLALLGALRRLTAKEWDTSRDPRVAILDRLAEVITGPHGPEIIPYTQDFDDAVVAAAEKIVRNPDLPKSRRYPFQPPESALASLPTQATITLKEGLVTLRLLPDVAPVTVARFAALVTQRFYNDRTFHRVVPNFVVQGGSPAANEYMGTTRYMRDEVGPQASHLRGAVGISTRGGDTGDGQLFIDLVDVPRLDRDYTVFAYVTQGMEFIDRLLEGAKIVSISVK
jgi:cyclophilin family peptidyl-prolyl cis-trans isomerase/HEAT repeat protein